MKTYFLLLFTLWFSLLVDGQSFKTLPDTVILKFGINESQLSPSHTNALNKVISKLKKDSCGKINVWLYGYTDADGGDDFNIKLAKKRINSVEEIIKKEALFSTHKRTPFAKKGKRKSIKSENRRVEVVFRCAIKSNSDSTFLSGKKLKIYQDSTAIYASGMEIVFPKDLVATLDTTNKFSRFEIIDKSINSDYPITGYTQDEDGNPLQSGGMFDAIFKNKQGEDTCLNHPITIRIPIKTGNCTPRSSMLPWKKNSKGLWEPSTDFLIKEVKINGKDYYEIKITCPGLNNLDIKTSRFQIKLKATEISNEYILDSAVVINRCKTIKLKGTPPKKGKSIKMIVPCDFEDFYVEYYFHHKETRETFISKSVEIKSHKKTLGLSFCRYQKKPRSKFSLRVFWPMLKKRTIKFSELTKVK